MPETAILAYAAKHASAFYGPFREAADSAPAFGDRRAYQMDPANGREALAEILADVAEGADMIMVKPALPALDLVAAARAATTVPIAAYQVSGEYAAICAAAERGWLDRRAAALESLTAIARAGAGHHRHLLRRSRPRAGCARWTDERRALRPRLAAAPRSCLAAPVGRGASRRPRRLLRGRDRGPSSACCSTPTRPSACAPRATCCCGGWPSRSRRSRRPRPTCWASGIGRWLVARDQHDRPHPAVPVRQAADHPGAVPLHRRALARTSSSTRS